MLAPCASWRRSASAISGSYWSGRSQLYVGTDDGTVYAFGFLDERRSAYCYPFARAALQKSRHFRVSFTASDPDGTWYSSSMAAG